MPRAGLPSPKSLLGHCGCAPVLKRFGNRASREECRVLLAVHPAADEPVADYTGAGIAGVATATFRTTI